MGGLFGGLIVLVELIGGFFWWCLIGQSAWKDNEDAYLLRAITGGAIVGAVSGVILAIIAIISGEEVAIVTVFSVALGGGMLVGFISFILGGIKDSIDKGN